MRAALLVKSISREPLRSLRPTKAPAAVRLVPKTTKTPQIEPRPPFPSWPEQSMAGWHLAVYESEVCENRSPPMLAQPEQNHIHGLSGPGLELNAHIRPNL